MKLFILREAMCWATWQWPKQIRFRFYHLISTLFFKEERRSHLISRQKKKNNNNNKGILTKYQHFKKEEKWSQLKIRRSYFEKQGADSIRIQLLSLYFILVLFYHLMWSHLSWRELVPITDNRMIWGFIGCQQKRISGEENTF